MRLRFLIIGLMFLVSTPAFSQSSGSSGAVDPLQAAHNACNTNLSSLLPNIPGLEEIRNLVAGYRQLMAQANSLQNMQIDQLIQLSRLIAQYSPQAIIQKIKGIINKIPGASEAVAAIAGGIFSEFTSYLNNPQLNNAISKLIDELNRRVQQMEQEAQNSALSQAEKTAIYQKISEILAKITNLNKTVQGELNGAVTEMQGANQQFNNILNNSNLGNTVNTLREVIGSYKDNTLIKKAQAIIEKVKAIKAVINNLRAELQKICGYLPDGSAKDQLLALIPDVLNGKVESILHELWHELEKELNKHVNAGVNALIGPLGGLTKGVVKTMVNTLGDILKSTLMSMLREAFWGLVNRSDMGKVLGDTACSGAQQAANATRQQTYAQLQQQYRQLEEQAANAANNQLQQSQIYQEMEQVRQQMGGMQSALNFGRSMMNNTIEYKMNELVNQSQGFWNTANVIKCDN